MRRSTRVAVVAAVLAVAVLVLALGSRPAEDTANGWLPVTSLAEVAGTYAAVNAQGAPAQLVGPVRLLVADGGVFLDTGCNTVRSGAHVESSRLVTDAMATTHRACPAPLETQETWVLQMLTARPRLERSGPMLALHWGEGERYWLGFELAPDTGGGSSPAPTV